MLKLNLWSFFVRKINKKFVNMRSKSFLFKQRLSWAHKRPYKNYIFRVWFHQSFFLIIIFDTLFDNAKQTIFYRSVNMMVVMNSVRHIFNFIHCIERFQCIERIEPIWLKICIKNVHQIEVNEKKYEKSTKNPNQTCKKATIPRTFQWIEWWSLIRLIEIQMRFKFGVFIQRCSC